MFDAAHQNSFSAENKDKHHIYHFSIAFETRPLKGINYVSGVVGANNEREARVYVYEQYEKSFVWYGKGMSDIKLVEVFPENTGVLTQLIIAKE